MQNMVTIMFRLDLKGKIKSLVQDHKIMPARLNLLSLNHHLAKDIGLENEYHIAKSHEHRRHGPWMQ